ncbi:MAG: T9SS type A sorting domain-containing protein [Bacteroidia bacterium]
MFSQLHKLHKNSFLLFAIVLLPYIGKSQTGYNDNTFNTYDDGRYAGEKGTNGAVLKAVVQSNNRTILVGNFTTYNLKSYNRIVRLNPDGNPDATFKPGEAANDKITCIALQSDKKMIVGGNFTKYNGTPLGYLARLNTAGKNDYTFKTGTGANAAISDVLVQKNGKIIVAGNFTNFNGTPAKGLIRLNINGNIDPSFSIKDTLFNIKSMVLQPDGKIILCYTYNYFQGLIRLNENGSTDTTYAVNYSLLNNPGIPLLEAMDIQADGKLIIATDYQRFGSKNSILYRLNSGGDIDTTFHYNNLGDKKIHIIGIAIQQNKEIIITGDSIISINGNINKFSYVGKLSKNGNVATSFSSFPLMKNSGSIYNSCVEADGDIIVYGLFSLIQGIPTNNVARLNSDGSFDVSYNKVSGANGIVRTTAVQPDGKTIIGGEFLAYNLVSRSHVARINNDGKLDYTFNVGSGTNGSINSLCIQSDLKIIIAGDFSEYSGFDTKNIARLNANGSFDGNFKLDSKINGIVKLVASQPDGKIFICGDFKYNNNTSLLSIYRLTANGNIDPSFSALKNAEVTSLESFTIQPDGKIILNGVFNINNESKRVVRLNTNGTLDNTFNCLVGLANTTVLQPDGKIIIGGIYQPFKAMYFGFLDRYNKNGTKDTTFQKVIFTGGAENYNAVKTITVHDSGKILVGGHFAYCNDRNMDNVSDLDKNGIEDSSFFSHANGDVYSSALLPDGKVIIAGAFSEYNNSPRNGIARIAFNKASATLREEGSTPSISNIAPPKELTVFLYPNPASTNLTIDNLIIGSTLIIRNTLGNIVYSTIVIDQKIRLEVSSYSNGIYFVTNEFNGSVNNIKFIVSK